MTQTTATITTLYSAKISKRQTLADLCEPDRAQDEALLRVIQGFEDRGREVAFEGEVAAVRSDGRARDKGDAGIGGHECLPSPNNFVSEYLTGPLRTEQQAREDRAKLHPVFAAILSPFRPVS